MFELYPDGGLFGLTDNIVLILGGVYGLSVEGRLEKYFPTMFAVKGAGAIYGAAIANTVSDGLGCLVDPTMAGMFVGVVLGCLLPIALIPAAMKHQAKRERRKFNIETDRKIEARLAGNVWNEAADYAIAIEEWKHR